MTEDWHSWNYGEDKPIYVPVDPGQIYCIIIQTDGTINYYILKEDDENGAKIAFLNACKNTMERMEVGEDWNTDTAAMALNLKPYEITHFVTAKSGKYALFYKLPNKKTYFVYQEEASEGIPLIPFEEGFYYVYLLFEDDELQYPFIFDITPEKVNPEQE